MASEVTEMCKLCLQSPGEFLNDLEVKKKIEKYLQIKMDYSFTGICANCHKAIEVFHEFYKKVHAAQKKLEEIASKNDAVLLTSDREKSSKSDSKEEEQCSKDQTENVYGSAGKINERKTTKRKLENSKLEPMLSEIEKRMVEFYNIKCEKCLGGKFTSFKMLSNHYWVVHNTQGYVRCCKRNIRVDDKYYLKKHMFKHLQPDSCRCVLCGKELSSTAALKHHMLLHKPIEERPFECSKCSKKFCSKSNLKNHDKLIHVPESERVDHIWICDACGKVFQKIANLRYHYSTLHLQERKYICEICAKCFTTQGGLKIHNNAAHTSLDPIQCQICSKWLKTKDTFQKHLQLHQNNAYPCTQCDKVCNSPASLRSHLVKHSEQRPHSCIICRKSFKRKAHLKKHTAHHLGGGHFKCPFCSKFFVNMSNFYTHRRKMHSGEKAKSFGNKSQPGDVRHANREADSKVKKIESQNTDNVQ